MIYFYIACLFCLPLCCAHYLVCTSRMATSLEKSYSSRSISVINDVCDAMSSPFFLAWWVGWDFSFYCIPGPSFLTLIAYELEYFKFQVNGVSTLKYKYSQEISFDGLIKILSMIYRYRPLQHTKF